MTALGVAMIRANESRRPDRLFDDPYAQLFVAAAEPEFTAADASAQAVETWATLQRLAPAMEQRAVSVRFLERYLLAAVGGGCRQVVELGAGLDSYALRLDWSRPCRYFEVDLPQLFDFKERVIAGQAATSERRVVPADMTGDWPGALSQAGFDAATPTAWLDGGVLDYLPRERVHRILADLHANSAPGSRFACVLPAEMSDATRTGVSTVTGRAGGGDHAPTGFGPGLADWLGERGWRVTLHEHHTVAAEYGRPPPAGASGGGYLTAQLP